MPGSDSHQGGATFQFGFDEPHLIGLQRCDGGNPVACGVTMIFSVRHPFEIRHMVIGLVSVQVVNLAPIFVGFEERFGHQAMHVAFQSLACDFALNAEVACSDPTRPQFDLWKRLPGLALPA